MPLSFYQQALGDNSSTFSAFNTSGLNNDNEIATPAINVPFCRPYQISVYFAGNGASVTARCVVWNTNGSQILAKSKQFTAPSGSASTGGQSLQTQFPDTWSFTGPGSVWIGFWRAAGGSSVWSVISSGTFLFKTDTSGDVDTFSGNSTCAPAFICGNIQAYINVIGGDYKTMLKGYPNYCKKR